MKFTLKELCSCGSYNPDVNKLEPWQKRNGEDIARKLSNLGYGPAMFGSSFARDYEAQKRINPNAMNSAHLFFSAVDVADPDGKLQAWLKTPAGKAALIEQGLWVEDFKYTPTWVHFQTYSVNSGNRFFKP